MPCANLYLCKKIGHDQDKIIMRVLAGVYWMCPFYYQSATYISDCVFVLSKLG